MKIILCGILVVRKIKLTALFFMGRKKKAVAEAMAEDGFKLEDILHSDAKRSIAAVFLFALSVLFFLAYFNAAGVLGGWLSAGVGMLFGWGKWPLPLLLIIAGLMFLQHRTTTLSDAVKFVGLTLGFFAVLGLAHLYSGDKMSELWKIASDGSGGGFVGFGFSYVLWSFTGKAAGTIILLALFWAGIIAAFNVSLIHFFERLKEKLRHKSEESLSEEGGQKMENTSLVTDEKNNAIVPEAISQSQTDGENLELNNIRNLQFHDEEKEKNINDVISGDTDEEIISVPLEHKRSRRSRFVRWELPPINLLESTTDKGVGGDVERNKKIIQETLESFGIKVEPGEALTGPTVTRYTFRPDFGVKLSRITILNNDLALALAAQSVRIEAPIPGQAFIGIEIPNEYVAEVRLREFLESKEFHARHSKNMMLVIGKDISGRHLLADLRKMPHLLIAGRTGSGKSVCINTLLLSLLYQNSPEDLKLILIDPKRVELAAYKGIPHLKTEVIVDNKKVVNVLRWAVGEMERRYKVFEEVHTRDLSSYREKCARGEMKIVTDSESGKVREENLEPLPYIVIVIDEMADLMVAHGKEVEALIIRLAQMSRAIGIHLILATQRPSVEVLTGLIKANIPARIAFQVTTQIDSRTILDGGGAEKLLGNGDMLYSSADGTDIKRLQGVLVSDEEVKRVAEFWRKQKEELGEDEIGEDFASANTGQGSITEALDAMDSGSENDNLYEEAKRLIIKTGKASTTSLQTAFSIGYPRAARLMHLLEENGVVGLIEGKRKVLLGSAENIDSANEEEKKYGDDHVFEQKERDKWQL
jgi:S-DNA-T family DNA segregation ATPase FtsK/SpoIIIE